MIECEYINVFVYQVIVKFGLCKIYKKFEVEIYVFIKDEGGCYIVFFFNYRFQFYLRIVDIIGRVELLDDVKMVMFGDNVIVVFEFIMFVLFEIG